MPVFSDVIDVKEVLVNRCDFRFLDIVSLATLDIINMCAPQTAIV